MPERTGYPDGEPCWTDVTTPALRFYTDLFRWESRDSFDNYIMFTKDGRPVAGLTPPHPGGPEDQAPPMWSVYLSTANVDESARRVERGGGKIVIPRLDFPDNGHMVYALDPTGAPFGLWQADGHDGSHLTGEPGTPCRAELVTGDGPAADAFYRDLFGYEQDSDQDQDGARAHWRLDGREVAGRTTAPGTPAHWMVYFGAVDRDATAARVVECGGTIRRPYSDSRYGRVAIAADPYGAAFGLQEVTP
jgi:predicted enzyme related to lactoylglutathione lyase